MKLTHPAACLLVILGVSFILLGAAKSADAVSDAPSAIELEQAFVIFDTLLPPKEKFDAHRDQKEFHPDLYIPAFKGRDFPQDFIDRLAVNHPRVMTTVAYRILTGRSYVPTQYNINWIHQKDATSAEARISLALPHLVILDHSSGIWVVRENKILVSVY